MVAAGKHSQALYLFRLVLRLSTHNSVIDEVTSSRTNKGRKPHPSSHSQILITSVLYSNNKYQINRGVYEDNLSLYRKRISLDSSATRIVASHRELEPPASQLTSHHSSGQQSWHSQHFYHLTDVSQNIQQAIREVTT